MGAPIGIGNLLKVGVDLDEVIISFSPTFTQYLKAIRGITADPGAWYDYDMTKSLGISSKGLQEAFREFCSSNYVSLMQPVNGAKEGIVALCNEFAEEIATSRPIDWEEKTMLQVTDFYRSIALPIPRVHFAQHPVDLTKTRTKTEIWLEQGIFLVIDDCLQQARDMEQKGIHVLLFDYNWEYGWNKSTDPEKSRRAMESRTNGRPDSRFLDDNTFDRIKRVTSWPEAINHALRYKQYVLETREICPKTSIFTE